MKARLLLTLAVAACFVGNLAGPGTAEESRRGPVTKAAAFLPFDFYSRHREALGLDEKQAREMERLAGEMREPAQKLESQRGARTKALLETMAQNPVDPEAAMACFQAVLSVENELKLLQFRNGIVMRNTLTPDQHRKLEVLAATDARAQIAGTRTGLKEQLQQLRAEIHKRSEGAPSEPVLERLKAIEQMAREGRAGEAKSQLEQLVQQLRQGARPAGETQSTR